MSWCFPARLLRGVNTEWLAAEMVHSSPNTCTLPRPNTTPSRLLSAVCCACAVLCHPLFGSQVAVHTVTLDMRDLAAVAQMPHQLPDEFREVDILINNAGLALGVTTVSDHDIKV